MRQLPLTIAAANSTSALKLSIPHLPRHHWCRTLAAMPEPD